MFFAKKIITAKQMKTYRAKNSSFMKDFKANGGGDILRRKVRQKELWGALRADSKSRKVGERGFTKKTLTEFAGKLLANDTDHFTNRKVKKISDIWGIKRTKLYRAAAEARVSANKIKIEQRNAERQLHQQNNIDFHNHVKEIISKGKQSGIAQSSALSQPSSQREVGRHNSLYHQSESFKGDIFNKFETSEKNLRNAEDVIIHSSGENKIENSSQSFGHLLFLKNKHHDYVGEEDETQKLKDRLALLQGKSDNTQLDAHGHELTI